MYRKEHGMLGKTGPVSRPCTRCRWRIVLARSGRCAWLAMPVLLATGPAEAQTLAPVVLRPPNGLSVLAIEDHTLPSVAVDILYKAGSRNERPGITGITHLPRGERAAKAGPPSIDNRQSPHSPSSDQCGGSEGSLITPYVAPTAWSAT